MPSLQSAVGLDVGSERVRCLVCVVEEDQLRFVGHAEGPSAGWQKGRVCDQQEVMESIRRVAKEAERNAQVAFEGVVLGVGGTHVEGLNSRGPYDFGRPREVTPSDLAYAVELAAKLRLPDDRMLMHVFPQDFTVDGRSGLRNPRGVVASRVEANAHLVTASFREHQALVAAVHKAHLAVEETVSEPVAASYAALLPDDRSRGVALVDVGLHSTNLAVYEGEALALAASLPVSGDHFTRDVTVGLSVPYDAAERLKREYGCAILGLTADNSLIEVPSADGRPPREASRRHLNEILEARAEELFLYVRAELAKVGMERSLLEGVVLCGGGAMLNGLADMAERVLNCPTRNGLPIGIDRLPDELCDLRWTTAAGLAMYSARLKVRQDGRRRGGMFGFGK